MRSSQYPSQMQVNENKNGLEVVSSVKLNGETILRRMWFDGDSPLVRCRIEGKAAVGHSVTVRFAIGISAKELAMDMPGGVVIRPPKRIYAPAFWPLHQFAHLQDNETGRGLAILQPLPGAVSYQPDGQLELYTMRNATCENVFGLIGFPGNPASGHERVSYAYEYALLFTKNGNWQDNNVHLLARNISNSPWNISRETALRNIADAIITTDNPDVWVAVIKSASTVLVSAQHVRVTKAFLCDARERNLSPLEVQDSTFQVK
ncbi:MAG: hypothetical protein U9R53_02470 [Chloroflexota bacterium]|nr:hypothetical protein [Chloroflexota bacterium]